MEEIWKKIVINNQETFYSVSNFGRVRNDKTKTILGGTVNNNGYCMVHLRQRIDKYCSVHRLVMKAFYPCENEDDLEINHKDGNKQNNHLDNLEWATRLENMRAYRSNKIGKCYQYDLDGNYIREFENFSEAARVLGIDSYSIWRCLREEYNHVGSYQFKTYKKNKIPEWCHPSSKKVFVYRNSGELVEVFKSQAAAARAFGVSNSSIGRYIKGTRKLEDFIFSNIPL